MLDTSWLRRTMAVVLWAALFLPPLPARGGNETGRGDLFLKAYTGLGLTADSDLRIVQPSRGNDLTFEGVSWDDRSLTGPSVPYLAVRLGYFFRRVPWLGLSADVMHFKVFADTGDRLRVRGQRRGQPIDTVQTLGRIVQRYNVANGVNMLLLNVQGRWRFGRTPQSERDRFELYLGAGAGPTLLYTHSEVERVEEPGGYDGGELGTQLFLGWQLNFRRHLDAFFEYKSTRTDANGPVPGGTSEARLSSDHYVFGFGYHF